MDPAAETESVSFEDLMTKGYFPDRVIPPVTSFALADALGDMADHIQPLIEKTLKGKSKIRSQCVTHSVPKRKHLRRSLSIPNPLHQFMAASEIADHWEELKNHCEKSHLALSVPTHGYFSRRALTPTHALSKQPILRARRSVGMRYLLKTDIARFYPSIYTHSIPWALHGKSEARADKKYELLGNRLDLWTRETQDRQTGGIPIGPDSSFLIGEIIGAAIDFELTKRIPNLKGTRSIDDYHLYFQTLSEAESALAVLHGIAKQYELEINDPKTEVIQLPDSFEPPWKSGLRGLEISSDGQPQATDLLTLFDRAFGYARSYPADSVLTYAAKQVLSTDIKEENWLFCEALLLRAALSEPTMLSVLDDIYDHFSAFHKDNSALKDTLESICAYHAPLQQGNEVAWALWLAKKMEVTISKSVGDKIIEIDDDIVALVALDLIELGLLQASKPDLWQSRTNSQNLYEDHWLLAYEAHEHGWLSKGKNDYVAADPFFSILQHHGVRFYGAELADTESDYGYDGDVDDDTYLESMYEGDDEAVAPG